MRKDYSPRRDGCTERVGLDWGLGNFFEVNLLLVQVAYLIKPGVCCLSFT